MPKAIVNADGLETKVETIVKKSVPVKEAEVNNVP